MPDTPIKNLPNQDVAYNNVFFGQLTSFHIRAQPEYDAAGRTTISTLYTISARSIQYPEEGGEVDLGTLLLERRRKLLESGKPLVIRGIGFGDTSTDSSNGTLPDIVWGPQPREANFQPLGGGVCYQLDWVCDFRIAECATSGGLKLTGKLLMAFNYDVTYSNDEWGFTTRVIQGTAMIPQIRGKDRTVQSVPLDYRQRVVVRVPVGYRRVRNDWSQNAAQNVLSFVIVDEQLKTEAPPEGIAKAEVTAGLTAKGVGGIFVSWLFTVSGTLETLPGFPKSWAAAKFFAIMTSYIEKLKFWVGRQSQIMPVSLEMRFGAFGRASQFSAAFFVPTTVMIDPLSVGKHVLYAPLPDSNYDNWRASSYGKTTLDTLWHYGGQSQLGIARPDIVNLCDPTIAVDLSSYAYLFPLSGGFPDEGLAGVYSGAGLTPRNSWMAYRPEMRLVRDDRKSVNKRDITITLTTPQYVDPKASFQKQSSSYPSYTAPNDKVTASGAPEQTLCFSGRAVRAGYPVTIPQIPAINGVKLDWLGGETDSIRGPSLIANVPMHYGSWEHYYRPQGYISADSLVMPHPGLDV